MDISKVKPVLLIDSGNSSFSLHDTIIEARKFAVKENYLNPTIYSLHSIGEYKPVWTLNTEPVANEIENKKTKKKAPRSAKAWTNLEVDTLVAAKAKGMKVPEIAEKLNRTPQALYTKLNALKKQGKLDEVQTTH